MWRHNSFYGSTKDDVNDAQISDESYHEPSPNTGCFVSNAVEINLTATGGKFNNQKNSLDALTNINSQQNTLDPGNVNSDIDKSAASANKTP